MKNFIKEFKEFISRGNVMDMAVGIIIGGAFTAIVTSLVNDVIMPLISAIFGGTNFDKWNVTLRGSGEDAVVLGLGNFLSAVINFLLIAIVIFCVIKAINKMHDKVAKKPEEEAPKTKICPFCKSEIPVDATRCPHCTSELDK
ncbi:MAG: large conductance mechanosensitive channel protein MscL [Eubacterium sp.]|nr:large conductance mechanosensitive channel protein MscL [Eubacterium sp.]